MNAIFFGIVLVAFIAGAINGTMGEITLGAVDSAKSAVTLAIGLVGIMSLFLGLMQVMQEASALRVIARIIRPVMVRLFPNVPEDHPAMGAMIMKTTSRTIMTSTRGVTLGSLIGPQPRPWESMDMAAPTSGNGA